MSAESLIEHAGYLQDTVRLGAFRAALEAMVEPGKSLVLDLASGTGILGMLACRAGARRVCSVESGPIVELARELAAANGFGDRMEFVRGLSTKVTLDEKFDLVVADQIGYFGINAGVLEYFADARERLLKPGARFIPSSVDLEVAPVEMAETHRELVEFWSTSPGEFDFSAVRGFAANTGFPRSLKAEELLGAAALLHSYDLKSASPEPVALACECICRRDGVCHGLGGWFTARLAPGISMTNSPLAKEPIRRSRMFFPIDPPVGVLTGDVLAVSMQILPREGIYHAVIGFPNGAKAVHSSWKGLFVSREDLLMQK